MRQREPDSSRKCHDYSDALLGGAAAYISVRPGITGLWQASGRSGTTYQHRVELDCRYVQELSLANDIRILWRTVGAVLRQAGAC
jgi:exopolysaccharide production protein ExoY